MDTILAYILQEQIAGDELTDYWTAFETLDRLPDEVVEAVTATGYLRCAPDSSRPDFSTIKNADAQYSIPRSTTRCRSWPPRRWG